MQSPKIGWFNESIVTHISNDNRYLRGHLLPYLGIHRAVMPLLALTRAMLAYPSDGIFGVTPLKSTHDIPNDHNWSNIREIGRIGCDICRK